MLYDLQIRTSLLLPGAVAKAEPLMWAHSMQQVKQSLPPRMVLYSSTVTARTPLLHRSTSHSLCNNASPTPSNVQVARNFSPPFSSHEFASEERSCSRRRSDRGSSYHALLFPTRISSMNSTFDGYAWPSGAWRKDGIAREIKKALLFPLL